MNCSSKPGSILARRWRDLYFFSDFLDFFLFNTASSASVYKRMELLVSDKNSKNFNLKCNIQSNYD